MPSTALPSHSPRVVVIGGGPAGLMAAETVASAGMAVALYDAMPSVGRKFLLAGVGGMNLTHSEAWEPFLQRYGSRQAQMAPLLRDFGATQVRDWAQSLGIDTFVGSSGRVFPTDMKAAPLLRHWLQRLRANGVAVHVRHRWQGWDANGDLLFSHPQGTAHVQAQAVVLALGGGSWPRLGSDGSWMELLAARGIATAPLRPANCGFDIAWSPHFRERFAGQALKTISVRTTPEAAALRGEAMISSHGIEGSVIYAVSAELREAIAAQGSTTLYLDLAPDKSAERIAAELLHPRGSRSMASHLQSRSGIHGVKAGLLREVLGAAGYADAALLARTVKQLPLTLCAPRPLAEAISSAGGVCFEALDEHLMLRQRPGIFCAGEMLDWEAPTGGYLLTGCFASGARAGNGVLRWLNQAADLAQPSARL